MIAEKAKKEIVRQEKRKRVVFIVKLLLLLGLLYVRFYYREWVVDEEGELSGWIKAVLFYLTANLLISLARIISVYLYIKQKQLANEENNVVLAINRIAILLNVAVLIGAFFLLVEIDWQTFFASFSLVAVATVLLTKDYISNTVNGLIIMVSDRISLNDYVKIGGHAGKVIDITLSNVHLLDDAKRMILIPNNTAFASDIINYTRKTTSYVEVNFDVKPEKVKDLNLLEGELIEAMHPYDELIKKNTYELMVEQVLTDKISLQFRFALRKPTFEKERELKHWVLKRVAHWVMAEDGQFK